MTILLHGFWGSPQDWSEVVRQLPLHEQVWIPNLYEPGPLAPHHNLNEWVSHFIDWIREVDNGSPVTLVGYSMGARLALCALMREPEIASRALLLSGRPTEDDFVRREKFEMEWRVRFHTQPWPELETRWQQQTVFTSTSISPKLRSDALREMLGQSLLNWSPRHHGFELDAVKELGDNVEWAFGTLDQKYMEVAKTLQGLPVQGQIHFVANAGHRILIDQPQFVIDWLKLK